MAHGLYMMVYGGDHSHGLQATCPTMAGNVSLTSHHNDGGLYDGDLYNIRAHFSPL